MDLRFAWSAPLVQSLVSMVLCVVGAARTALTRSDQARTYPLSKIQSG
jgi:hypothetical protein